MHIGSEFRWILEGFTPNTIPMTRLAEYMQQLGKLLGEEASVHFVRVEANCVALVSQVERGSAPGKVRARLASVRDGTGPQDAARAYQLINSMLADDKTHARLTDGSATIIRFPGHKPADETVIEVIDTGALVGHLYMLSESKDGYQARLRLNANQSVRCSAAGKVALALRGLLFEDIRAFGRGVWTRGSDRVWNVQSFEISDVEAIDKRSLRSAVNSLRSLNIKWPDDPLGYLDNLNGEGGAVQ